MATALVGLGATSATAGAVTKNKHVVTYQLNCNVLNLLTLPVTVTTFDASPGSVPAGGIANLSAVRSRVAVPASFVNLALSFGLTTLSGSITAEDFNATNTANGTVNAAATPIPVGPVTLVANQPAVLHVPAAPVTVGPWTAGTTVGSTITYTPGEVDMTVLIPITCQPVTTPSLGHTVIRAAE
ncbi:MAG: hypothetical protein J2P57_06275 [Acidimicrobiaceae bacterium]|nr:hypothetical protein [Acidimicrobiaceae bacterium]